MTFNSPGFFIFLPAALIVYFIIPGKWRTSWLLLTGYAFYMSFSPVCAAVLLLVTAVSYCAGLKLEAPRGDAEKRGDAAEREPEAPDVEKRGDAARQESGAAPRGTVGNAKKRKRLFTISVAAAVLLLVFFKYTGFLLDNINRAAAMLGMRKYSLPFSIVMPVGVSYFTFQVISYLTDIYQGKIRAERNFLYYALYISFFPKIISGPIERAEDFMRQIRDCAGFRLWDGERASGGLILMIWGYFQKLVIADRLAILTGEIFGNYQSFGAVELWVGAAAFYIQLYADFNGYMDIARGMAKIMGFTLAENFNAPFFAKSVKEYWTRWHISLSGWLRDYIYIPLGGNRRGTAKRYRNLLITFLISGIWHGAAWNYVFWGMLHGVYQVVESAAAPYIARLNEKLHTRTQSFGYRLFLTVKCWLLVCIGYIFFQTPTAADGLRYMKRMLTRWDLWALFDGSLFTLGVSEKYFHLLLAALILLLLVDWLKYKKHISLDAWLAGQCIWFRWGVMLTLILSVIIFGAYGPAYDAENFIYFQF